MSEDREGIEVPLYYHGPTKSGLAIMFTEDGNKKKRDNIKFLPVSQITITDHPKNENIKFVLMPEWLAKKNGLI
jgi:hypothetical protein